MNKEFDESIGGEINNYGVKRIMSLFDGKTMFKQATDDEINKYELELIEAMRAIHYPGRWDTTSVMPV